ncbi:MAG: ATP--guanido phosphotransferase [Planctomycetes bacterium]|nr:ATP--guanido phosphotransferase [Planctomycetota bacterium]
MELFLPELASRRISWLSGEGPDSDVIVSTRARLARNLRGFPFAAKMTEDKARELCEHVQTRLRELEVTRGMNYLQLRQTTDICRDVLLERFLVSRELAESRLDRAVAFEDAECASIMINEEDHLRLQTLRPGFDLEQSFERILSMDRALESTLEYAWSEELGYLTSCPTNVGTGLRVSVMLHLPGLVTASRELKRVFTVAACLNLAVRGLHGEGTQASGAFFQVSNQITLGRTEREIMEDLTHVIGQIIEFERKVRHELIESKGDELKQRLDFEYEFIKSGRPVGVERSVIALSALLLGIVSGTFTSSTRGDILKLLVLVYPGHLQASLGRRFQSSEIDRERGSMLRRFFETKQNAPGAAGT